MAISATTKSVTTNSTLIFDPAGGGSPYDCIPVAIFNNDAAATLYLGGSTVTTAAGFPVKPLCAFDAELFGRDAVYGISTGTIDVRVMMGRQ